MLTRLATAATSVVQGRATSLRSEYGTNAWGDQLIYTTVDFAVDEVLAGPPLDGAIRFRYEGGTVGEIELRVSNQPTLARGERVIVFVKDTASGERQLVGHELAKLTVGSSMKLDGIDTNVEGLKQALRSMRGGVR